MIAVDAMGGDFAPQAIVRGAFFAASLNNIPVALYGDSSQIDIILDQLDLQWRRFPICVVHCSQVVTMDEEPTRAFIKKKDSSLMQALHSVVEGKASAVITAGNTGAGLVAGMMVLKKVDGIMRPALGQFLPTKNGSVFCIDLGANVDCKPENLYQFAQMGHTYVQIMQNIKNPRIAILSNGAEESKGSKTTLQAYALLAKSELNFVGNIEPAGVLSGGADVLVCDGFTGNIMLKTVEAIADIIPELINQKTRTIWFGSLVKKLSNFLVTRIRKKASGKHQDGALLLGLKHPLIIAHGSSNAEKIRRAITLAHSVVSTRLLDRFNDQLSYVLNGVGRTSLEVSPGQILSRVLEV